MLISIPLCKNQNRLLAVYNNLKAGNKDVLVTWPIVKTPFPQQT